MTRKWDTSLIRKGMAIWYRKTWITLRTRVIKVDWNLIVQTASLCPSVLIQISVISCKVISSETEICELCLEVPVNHWLQMLRGWGKGKFVSTGWDISSRHSECVSGGGSVGRPSVAQCYAEHPHAGEIDWDWDGCREGWWGWCRDKPILP